jgi:hypothetical protein
MSDAMRRVATLCANLKSFGFDIVTELNTSWYNAEVAGKSVSTLPDNRFGLLIGNSKALWEPFLQFVRDRPRWRILTDPLDSYTQVVIGKTVRECFPDSVLDIRFVFETTPERLVGFQKLALVSGLAAFHPQSHLCIHSEFGPWLSFRALIVFDWSVDVCGELGRKSVDLDKVITPDKSDPLFADYSSSGDWRQWINIRSSVGSQMHRFSLEQILFHYARTEASFLENLRLPLKHLVCIGTVPAYVEDIVSRLSADVCIELFHRECDEAQKYFIEAGKITADCPTSSFVLVNGHVARSETEFLALLRDCKILT